LRDYKLYLHDIKEAVEKIEAFTNCQREVVENPEGIEGRKR
jgi:uncharacterized protein with HEPN domain